MNIKKKMALLKRWTKIATGRSVTAVKQGVGKHYDKNDLKGYYNDLTLKVSEGTLLSDDGIPLSEIAGGEKVHFPIAVFQYGLALYDLFLETNDESYRLSFMNISDWALQMQREDGSWDAFGPMKSKKYTVSSMCQGEGASLLFRAGKVSNDDKFTSAAFRAIDFMLRAVGDGGTSVYKDNDLYLEEYPQDPKRSVLNGWIFSAFGLYDASIIAPSKYKKPLDQTINTLCRNLKAYDNGYWSMYDMQGKIASPAYHELHIALLTVLADLTERNEIFQFKNKLSVYNKSRSKKVKAILNKLIQKLTEDSDVITVQ